MTATAIRNLTGVDSATRWSYWKTRFDFDSVTVDRAFMFYPFSLFSLILMKGSSLHAISEAFLGEGDRSSEGLFRQSVGVMLEEAVQPRISRMTRIRKATMRFERASLPFSLFGSVGTRGVPKAQRAILADTHQGLAVGREHDKA
jgi:hypothetical protein